MARRRPGLNAAFRSLSFSNAQVWQNNLGWERRAATLWGYKLEFNLRSLAKLKPSSAVIIPLTLVFHSLPLCHPAEWEEIHLTLKNTQKDLKIRFAAATKVLDFYQHLDHACRGLKRFLEMADEENGIQGVGILWQKPWVTLDEKEATNRPVCHSGLQLVPVRPFVLIRTSAKCPWCLQCMENSEGHPRKSSLQGLERKGLTVLTLTGLLPHSTNVEKSSLPKSFLLCHRFRSLPILMQMSYSKMKGHGLRSTPESKD